MRLLKLKVRNIASLKGEHEVDFEDIQSRSQLFAITGETGAGKSSLLNSIGLALYGQVFKRNVIQNDLVTLGEKEGQIELLFEARGTHYLAFWRARVLKANGEPYSTPQSPTRELYTVDGSSFTSARTITTEKVENILNLDFDQFCKCIILNQGEFARFLLSTFTERKAILEKLYPGTELENLNQELRNQLEKIRLEKSEIEVSLQTLQGESGNTANLEEIFKQLSGKLKIHESWFALIEDLHKHFHGLQTYHRNHGDYVTKKAQTEQEFATETTQYNLLLKNTEASAKNLSDAREILEKRQPRLEELLKIEVKLQQDRLAAQDIEKDLGLITQKMQKAEAEVKTLDRKRNELKTELKTLEDELHYPLAELLQNRHHFPDLFDLWHRRSQLQNELKLLNENLQRLEGEGKENLSIVESLKAELNLIPKDADAQLQDLLTQKKKSSEAALTRQKIQVQLQETKDQLSSLARESKQLEEKIGHISQRLEKNEAELLPLQTALKLQEVLTAVRTCLRHEEGRQKGECPVCAQSLPDERWGELLSLSEKNDFDAMERRRDELKTSSMKDQADLNISRERMSEVLLVLNEKKAQEEKLTQELKTPVIDEKELESKIEALQKLVWNKGKILGDLEKAEQALTRARTNYRGMKDNIVAKSTEEKNLLKELSQTELSLKTLLPQGITDSALKDLRLDDKILGRYTELDQTLQKIQQQISFLNNNLDSHREDQTTKTSQLKLLQERIHSLDQEIKAEVQDEGPGKLLEKLRLDVKEAETKHRKTEEALKQHQLKLQEFQAKIHSYRDQIAATEIIYSEEMLKLRALAQHQLPALNEELTTLTRNLSALSLTLGDMPELFVPLSDLLTAQKEGLKTLSNNVRSELGATKALLAEWEKRKDKIRLLHLSLEELQTKGARLTRLAEVLGKDELRSFVLSLVEENLIHQTNRELGRLCQGRYEIIHQNKGKGLSPEFYILDKFREGGRRKVSTLSGGETFMVSLAMALGLAEMTRGQAEIDSLFIDEGFGTLDQESLEDVLEMLGQIQTRGLLVGIISHVKALTSALPVNLVLNKKSDGTSSISLRFN